MTSSTTPEFNELQQIWHRQEQRLQQQWQLTRKRFREQGMDQARHLLDRSIRLRSIELLAWVAVQIGLGAFIGTHWQLAAPTVSAGILFMFSILGIIGVASEIQRMKAIDFSAPILEQQRALENVRTHRLLYFRLSMISVPLYLAHVFFWCELLLGFDLYPVADPIWLISNIILSVLLIYPTIWFTRQLAPNAQRGPFLERFVQRFGGKSLNQALKQLNQLQEFEVEAA